MGVRLPARVLPAASATNSFVVAPAATSSGEIERGNGTLLTNWLATAETKSMAPCSYVERQRAQYGLEKPFVPDGLHKYEHRAEEERVSQSRVSSTTSARLPEIEYWQGGNYERWPAGGGTIRSRISRRLSLRYQDCEQRDGQLANGRELSRPSHMPMPAFNDIFFHFRCQDRTASGRNRQWGEVDECRQEQVLRKRYEGYAIPLLRGYEEVLGGCLWA